MNGQATLRDAFNREVFPNRGQPGAYGMGGGNAPVSYEAAGSFGTASTSFASYSSGGGYPQQGGSTWPSYRVPMHSQMPQAGTSQYYGEPAYSGSDCNTCDMPSSMGYGGNYSTGSGGYGAGSGYGRDNSAYTYGVSELTGKVYEQPATYAHMLNNFNKTTPMNQVNTSVNDMLINYLKQTIVNLTQQLRAQPDWVDVSPDGGASWKYSNMVQGNSLWCRVFTKVSICAERKAYTKPLPHIGNITTTTKIKLNRALLPQLQREFPMMSYCPSTKTLQITMDSLEHCLAILALICACQQDKIGINKIKYYDLCKKYLLLTTPGHRRYRRGAKYALVRLIRK